VIVVVIAGIRLVISQGEEQEKDKAKKTIFYAIIGLIIILFAQAIVGFVQDIGEEAGSGS
jgi:predicted benzoate:H+ symporter BenE